MNQLLSSNMEWTGERYIPTMSGEIGCEHMNRYYFAVNQIDMKDKVVLDIASGEGYGTNLLSRFAATVYGIDNCVEAIEHAKKQYTKENLTFILADAVSIPLKDNSIDIVVSFETIEHLEKHQEMIDELKRVLKKDGILIISSPDKLHYSDFTGDKNHFHEKELYYYEFKALINCNFSRSYFFSQTIFIGSTIALDDGYIEYSKPLIIDNKEKKTFLEPKYNIAISTNSETLSLPYTMINYTENNRMIIPEDVKYANYEGQLQVSNSLPYKLGAVIISPFKKLSNAITTLLSL